MTTGKQHTPDPGPRIARRNLVKGAAWSVPVIAAAVATPLASASTPACPACIKAGLPVIGGALAGTWSATSIVSQNKGTIALSGAFGLDATSCGISFQNIFQPAFSYVVTSATLQMSDGNVYNSTAGLGIGTGNISTVGAFGSGFVFTNVSLPNGGSLLGFPRYAPAPETLTVTVTTTLQYGLGAHLQCPTTLVWDLHGSATGLISGGLGTISFAGTATV